jgi:hypothetical protein
VTTINLTYRAELRGLTDALGRVEGMNAGLAKKLTNDLERAYNSAAKAARRASSDMERDTARAFSAIKQSAGSVFGGIVRDMDDWAEAIGSLGLSAEVALGVGAVSAAALAVGVVAVTAKASEAAKRLDEMGLAAEIPASARASLAAYDEAVGGLGVSVDLVTARLGGAFAPALTDLTNTLGGAIDAVGDLSLTTADGAEAFAEIAENIRANTPLIGSLTTALGLQVDVTETLAERGARLAGTYADLRSESKGLDDDTRDLLVSMGMMSDAEADAAEALKRAEEGERTYRAAVQETADEINERARMHAAHLARMADATEGLAAIEQSAAMATATATEKIEAEYQARIAKIHELAQATGDLDAIQGATAAAEQARSEGLAAALDAQMRAEEAAHQESLRRAHEIRDAYAMTADSVFTATSASFAVWASTTERAGAELVAQLEAHGAEMTDDERAEAEKRLSHLRKSAAKAFKISQAVQIAQAEMAAALAAIEAYSSVVGLPVVGPVLAPIAAASALAFGLAQSANIASQQPPSFHMGGVVDDVPTTLQRGEAVLTRRGRAAFGDDAIEAANRGMAAREQRPVRVEVVYQHRAFRPFFRDFAAAGGLDQYLPPRSTPIGHRAR